MAYSRQTNLPTDSNKTHRTYEQKQTSHRFFQQHEFTNEITTTATTLDKLIAAQPNIKPMVNRTYLELTNPNTSGTIYISRIERNKATTVTSTNYQWALGAGGYLKVPCESDMDIQLVGSGTLPLVATEVQ